MSDGELSASTADFCWGSEQRRTCIRDSTDRFCSFFRAPTLSHGGRLAGSRFLSSCGHLAWTETSVSSTLSLARSSCCDTLTPSLLSGGENLPDVASTGADALESRECRSRLVLIPLRAGSFFSPFVSPRRSRTGLSEAFRFLVSLRIRLCPLVAAERPTVYWSALGLVSDIDRSWLSPTDGFASGQCGSLLTDWQNGVGPLSCRSRVGLIILGRQSGRAVSLARLAGGMVAGFSFRCPCCRCFSSLAYTREQCEPF